MKLTAKQIAKLIRSGKKGKYPDGHNLYLQIQNRNNASWVFRYERDGKERFPGLGPFHTVGLQQARERAKALRLQLLDGIDPIAAKKAAKVQRALDAAKAMSFNKAARGYLDQHSATWRNARHAMQWSVSLQEYVEPIIGTLPVGEIDTTLVLKVLEQEVAARRGSPAGSLWMTRPETASRLRGRIENILDWAKARGYRTGENPASWSVIGQVLPARGQLAKVSHHPALAYSRIPEFMAKLRARTGSAAMALEFSILTSARSGETIGAKWSEIDLDAVRIDPKTKKKIPDPVWTVPAGRMKAGKEHRIPLADRAVEILKALPREAGGGNDDFVFVGPSRAGLSHAAMAVLLKRLDDTGVTVHGFRSSFRDYAGESTAFPSDVCEAALAHIKGKTERAYQRGDLFFKRRRLMEAWADYCASPPKEVSADIIKLRGA